MHSKSINIPLPNITRIQAIAKPVISVIVLASIGLAANQLITTYSIGDAICTTTFAAAAVVAIVYRAINPYGWTLVLSGLGYQTKVNQSIRIWLLSESRRWLPGGVWGYASRAVQAGKMGVPVSVASASMLIELLVTIAAAVVVSLLGLMLNYDQLSGTFQQLISDKTGSYPSWAVGWATIAVAAIVALGLIARHKLTAKAKSFVQRFAELRRVKLTWSKLFAATAYMTAMAGLNGCVNQTLLPIVDGASVVPLHVMIAATATAWIIGFLAFFSPGGILVREAALAALLLPWLPYDAGITLAVLSRIAQLVAEVVCMIPVLRSDRNAPALAGEVA